MCFVSRSEHHLIRIVFRVLPPLGEQIPRLDRICIDQRGLAIPDVGKWILDEAVNGGDVVCTERSEVSCVAMTLHGVKADPAKLRDAIQEIEEEAAEDE